MFQSQNNNLGFTGPNKSSGLPPVNIISLHDASVKFDSVHALKNIELTIAKGEIVFVTGASGAGKTTLLRMLSGDIAPTSGMAKHPFSRREEFFVARVFQDLRLIPELTCEANLNIAYDPSLYDSRKAFEKDKAELCRVLSVSDRMKLKIKDANGGLQQKIAIIRTLLTKPDVLIADEPTSALDSDNGKRLFEVLNYFNMKRGMTIVWATHDKELVKSFSGRILHLDGGRLVYSGHACFI
ncbi:MAG: hypothetical protein COW01_08500 [Bdellovibrionales bacterium CG12_big_fil_rev_8_21_14_0_65_38_15]|nr:MAG: hypothetical protein COW79_04280 [Bdellovibrionales bacterium CG22_combo_CG10-13_8_21_14_all_38_13]PIQ55169.1 MAG: hypothetical protein COW01_08500 [Bdellovibrionales bacterium CG12_big_fil_rev_8_21_14_0_65_38_15]